MLKILIKLTFFISVFIVRYIARKADCFLGCLLIISLYTLYIQGGQNILSKGNFPTWFMSLGHCSCSQYRHDTKNLMYQNKNGWKKYCYLPIHKNM